VRRRFNSWTFLLAILLVAGLLVGRWLWTPSDLLPATSFREWWWDHRQADVAVQMGLLFAGALGIAALMPPETEA